MSRFGMWWHYYRDQGLVGKLGMYTVWSYAVAGITYAIPYASENYLYTVTTCLALTWLVIVIRGTVVCGWPSVILWLPIYWALYWPGMVVMIVAACYFGRCI
jgi:hypothetical protein